MRMSFRALLAALALSIVLPASVFAYWPVADRYAYVSQGYSSTHPAMDLAAPEGTRVVPVQSGRVVFAGWKSNCGGRQVWLSNGYGLYTAYYHLENISVWKGEWVSGQVTTLGHVGMTGCATGPHTHLETWRGYPWASGSYRIRPWGYIDSGWYLPYRYR